MSLTALGAADPAADSFGRVTKPGQRARHRQERLLLDVLQEKSCERVFLNRELSACRKWPLSPKPTFEKSRKSRPSKPPDTATGHSLSRSVATPGG